MRIKLAVSLGVLPTATPTASNASFLAAAREIFGPNFQPSESLKALTYFEDGDLSSLTQSQKEVLIQAAIAVRDLPIVEIQSKCLTA